MGASSPPLPAPHSGTPSGRGTRTGSYSSFWIAAIENLRLVLVAVAAGGGDEEEGAEDGEESAEDGEDGPEEEASSRESLAE